jgi:hypothetical protein
MKKTVLYTLYNPCLTCTASNMTVVLSVHCLHFVGHNLSKFQKETSEVSMKAQLPDSYMVNIQVRYFIGHILLHKLYIFV